MTAARKLALEAIATSGRYAAAVSSGRYAAAVSSGWSPLSTHAKELAQEADAARDLLFAELSAAQAEVECLRAELEAQPVARTPLSDERMDGITRFVTGTVFGRVARGRAIARLVEAAHGITQESKQGEQA